MHSGHWAMVIEGGRIVAGGSGNGQGPRGKSGDGRFWVARDGADAWVGLLWSAQDHANTG